VTRQLVLVHGRSQQFKDAVELKRSWIEAWRWGLAKSNLDLPIAESDIRFPYYGQTLHDLVAGVPDDQVADVVVRGVEGDPEQAAFVAAVLDEVRAVHGITDAQVQKVADRLVVERGPLDWSWLHKVVETLDAHLPGASGSAIALATADVYSYLKNPGVRDAIETGVRRALADRADAVVVGHSLGSVVAYNLLKREGEPNRWRVALLVTVGSPLGVTHIRRALRPIGRPACVGDWFNARDPRDVVALYPLDTEHFGIQPPIENSNDVVNHTANRHGIAGYLDNKVVARRLHDALTAP
jgi:hypothetical protein